MTMKKSFAVSFSIALFILVFFLVLSHQYSVTQEKQKEIRKEDAIAKAMKFARFKAVSEVSKPRVNYSHTQYYIVTGTDEKGQLQIGINPINGEVIRMLRLCPYHGLFVEKLTFKKEEAIRICRNFLRENKLPDIPKGYTVKLVHEKKVMKYKQYRVVFRHFEDEIPVATDFISFILSGTGEIVSYSKVHHDVKVSTRPEISKDKAQKLASEILGKEKLKDYPPELEVIDVALKIVYPNHYFKKWEWEWSEEQALVWVVKFGKEKIPALDVWVDAQTGRIQGGEVYERPIPELIGIPNQTGDITGIWQPALDIMQYNVGTAHTFLGDTTEAAVVDAIENGFVFVLQTHGDTTATAERAIIGHTGTFDARNMTPDEVPENDLYYALVSCCQSGNDGTGNDFKDTFIDQGALCFQGYHPYINPDPYERALVRYMAQGRCLQNAHLMADADINPTFDIIIEWQAWCWNAIYLAPLKVSISVPSNPACTFTISASVYNGEAALATTANDVYAFLDLPPGFTITSGSILQNSPSIPYGHSWTATWTVSAPIFTFGSKTFDVIVWSDNLGVAVHDFDNPYHKFTVNVSCPLITTIFEIAIREIFRWWDWAEELYPENSIPRKILKYHDLFFEKYRSEYFFKKDPQAFFKAMMEITREEISFGKTASKMKNVDKVALREYMNTVDEMKEFLGKVSKKKIVNVFDLYREVGKLQKVINEKATVAFGPKVHIEKAKTRKE